MSECLCHLRAETCEHCTAGTDVLKDYQKTLGQNLPLLPGFIKACEVCKQCESLQEMEEAIDFLLCSINEQASVCTSTCPTLAGLEQFSEALTSFNSWPIFVSAMEKFEASLLGFFEQNPEVKERLDQEVQDWAEGANPEPPAFVDLGPDASAMMPGLDFVLDLFKQNPSPEVFQQNFMAAYKSAMVQSSEMILSQLRGQFKIEGDIVIQGDRGVCITPESPLYARLLTKKVKRQGEEPSWCPSKDLASPSVINRAKEIYEYQKEVSSIPQGAARMNVANTLGPFSFQRRTSEWMHSCFEGNLEIINDVSERHARFIEEALELVQAGGFSKESAQIVLDYVYSRPAGELTQEVGGVGVTLAALCAAHSVSMEKSFETELARVSSPETQARIREKQKSKPAHSPLPGAYPERITGAPKELSAPYGTGLKEAPVQSVSQETREEMAEREAKLLIDLFTEDWMNEEEKALFVETLWSEAGDVILASFLKSLDLGYSLDTIKNELFIELARNYFKRDPEELVILETFLRNGFTIKPGEKDLKPYVYQAARALLSKAKQG